MALADHANAHLAQRVVMREYVSPSWRLVAGFLAGAVIGVIAANVISGGMITPILMGVGFGMPAEAAAVAAAPVAPAFAAMPAAAANVAAPVVAATSATMVAAHAGIIVVGSAIGAAVGNWLVRMSY